MILKIKAHIICQSEISILVTDLVLSKEKAELLTSKLKQWNLLQADVNITHFRNRYNDLIYCSNINGLIHKMGHQHIAGEWILFIDASKNSLKAVLLHNGNKLPSLPIDYGARFKETYYVLKFILEKIEYSMHN